MNETSARIRASVGSSQGAYGAAALNRINAMADAMDESAVQYRSLEPSAASRLYAARSLTQSSYD